MMSKKTEVAAPQVTETRILGKLVGHEISQDRLEEIAGGAPSDLSAKARFENGQVIKDQDL